MYHLLKLMALLASLLSPRGMEIAAGILAAIAFDMLRLRRRVALANLRRVFGAQKSELELRQLARLSYRNFGLTALEFLRGDRRDIAAAIDFVGLEHVRGALAQGHGAYILCLHLGNWEAMGAKIARTIVPAHVFVKKVGSDSVNRFVSEVRAKNGFMAVPRLGKMDGVRAVKTALRRGEIVGFVMDQARPGEPRLPFFGVPAKTNTGLAAIRRRLPAPVIPATIRRLAPERHVIEFLPEVELRASADARADIQGHSVLFNQIIETMILARPEEYFWMHNRWK